MIRYKRFAVGVMLLITSLLAVADSTIVVRVLATPGMRCSRPMISDSPSMSPARTLTMKESSPAMNQQSSISRTSRRPFARRSGRRSSD